MPTHLFEDSPALPVKILYLIQGSSEPAGIAVARRKHSRFLPLLMSQRDLYLDVLTVIGKGDLHILLQEAGLPADTINGDPWLRLPRGIVRLAKQIRRIDPDLIHAGEPIPAVVAGLARRLSGASIPVTYFRYHEYGSPRLQFASRAAARLTDATFVQSKAVAARAMQLDGSTLDRVRVVRSGVADVREVSPEEVADLRSRLGIPADAPVIGTVSRLRPEKGLDHLIEAVERLSIVRPDAHLVIAGDGSRMEDLREMASVNLGPRAHLVGHQDDIALWFAVMDVVVMPSLREAFGFAGLEAMACRRPIVSSKVGGLVEAFEGSGAAVFVPPSDPDILSRTILDLIRDAPLRKRMGEVGRSRYERMFTLEHMAASLTEAWEWTMDRCRQR